MVTWVEGLIITIIGIALMLIREIPEIPSSIGRVLYIVGVIILIIGIIILIIGIIALLGYAIP